LEDQTSNTELKVETELTSVGKRPVPMWREGQETNPLRDFPRKFHRLVAATDGAIIVARLWGRSLLD